MPEGSGSKSMGPGWCSMPVLKSHWARDQLRMKRAQ
jgi:hypothetical protein